MISFLCPTRKRWKLFERMVVSLHEMCKGKWDCVAYVDNDDIETQEGCRAHADAIKMVVGPRIILTDAWNKCLPLASGNIYCQMNDDCIARTPGFDLMVEGAFAQCADKILMVYGDDLGMHHGNFGPHPFVHKRYVEALGYFIPPYFSSEYGDAWVNFVTQGVDRRRFLPFIIEHMHYEFKKAEFDETYRERVANHKRDNCDHIWETKAPDRLRDVEKLRALLGIPWQETVT